MGVEISIVGQASKRGPLRRAPSADRVVEEIGAWIHDAAADVLRGTRLGQAGPGTPALVVDLHPAARDLRIVVSEDGSVSVTAPTSEVGPGYHTYVGRLLERLGDELDIAWEASGEASTGRRAELPVERADVERRHLLGLRETLLRVREARERGLGAVQLSRVTTERFEFDGALATPLGPRDDAWLERAVSDPRIAIDVWPWFADATDARYLLDRALCLMWTDVRWRVPAADGEAALFAEALRLLRKAYALDPSLAYPWREWRELLRLSGPAEQMSPLVDEKAAATIEGARIGYRHRPVTVVHAGWTLEIPGSFAERVSEGEWWAGEAGRSITLAGVETGSDGRPMPAETFLRQVAADLGDDALTHHDDRVVGRARLGIDPSSGVEVAVLDGYSAVTGRGAAIRVVIDDPADWEWALQIWRGLQPAQS